MILIFKAYCLCSCNSNANLCLFTICSHRVIIQEHSSSRSSCLVSHRYSSFLLVVCSHWFSLYRTLSYFTVCFSDSRHVRAVLFACKHFNFIPQLRQLISSAGTLDGVVVLKATRTHGGSKLVDLICLWEENL